MTPEEKAKELVDKIHITNKLINYDRAKMIALICVGEIIDQLNIMWDTFNDAEILGSANHALSKIKYWEEVKEEITKTD